jgi:hypothetical protein
MTRELLIAILALGAATTANAEFNYNFVQGTYGQVDFDNPNVDGDNFGLGASLALTDQFHLFGNADFADLDANVDATAWEAGVGYNTSITPIVDVVAQLSFQSVEIDTPFGNADDTGYGLGVLLRVAATDFVELNGGIKYVDFDDSGDNTAFVGAVLFNATDRVSFGLNLSFDDDAEQYGILGRIYF